MLLCVRWRAVLPLAKTLFHDKPYADGPVLVPDADEDTHFLPAVRRLLLLVLCYFRD